jgi:hypothetical protein
LSFVFSPFFFTFPLFLFSLFLIFSPKWHQLIFPPPAGEFSNLYTPDLKSLSRQKVLLLSGDGCSCSTRTDVIMVPAYVPTYWYILYLPVLITRRLYIFVVASPENWWKNSCVIRSCIIWE